jgi:polyisoprenoid-binding protein YceI
MKKIILSAVVFAAVLTSCSDGGTKVESKEAEVVEVKTTETTETFTVVGEGSHVDWRAAHLGGVQPRFGKIMVGNAEVLTNNNKLTNAVIEMSMASFTVENFEDEESKMKLTGHLQGDDFFKVEAHPTSIFELTSIEDQAGDYNSKLTGNLTILGATKSISFLANVSTSDNAVSVKSEDFVIDRTEWGLVYNVEGTEGVPADYLISNDIGFTVDVNMTK